MDNKTENKTENKPVSKPENKAVNKAVNKPGPGYNRKDNNNIKYNGYNKNTPKRPNNTTDFKSGKPVQGTEASKPDMKSPRNNGNNGYKKHTGYKDYHKNNNHKIRVEETLEDIISDMARIEKEIELEIKEIISMRLGL